MQDRTIIAIAIPRMTDDFHSFGDIGWYGSAYLLTNCAFQLLLGRVYTFYNPKVVFLGLVIIFEIGSAICGGAPNSTAFIFGRAIAGLGSAGIFSGTIIVMIYICPLQKRALYQGILGGVFGIASVLGPLLGGAFTTNVTSVFDHLLLKIRRLTIDRWRWCFYINLPIGAVTFVTLFCILKLPASKKPMPSFREQLAQLDPIGTFCFIPSIVCLLLALQWGGSTYDWNDGRIIALLVLFGISLLAFIAVQAWKQDSATVPPRIILHRSIAAGVCFSMCIGASMLVMVYYLPLWFQVGTHHNTINIDTDRILGYQGSQCYEVRNYESPARSVSRHRKHDHGDLGYPAWLLYTFYDYQLDPHICRSWPLYHLHYEYCPPDVDRRTSTLRLWDWLRHAAIWYGRADGARKE